MLYLQGRSLIVIIFLLLSSNACQSPMNNKFYIESVPLVTKGSDYLLISGNSITFCITGRFNNLEVASINNDHIPCASFITFQYSSSHNNHAIIITNTTSNPIEGTFFQDHQDGSTGLGYYVLPGQSSISKLRFTTPIRIYSISYQRHCKSNESKT